MDQNAFVMLMVGVAIASALFAVGVVVYPKLKSQRQNYPFEAEIEAALLPLIFNGICSAYRLSEKGSALATADGFLQDPASPVLIPDSGTFNHGADTSIRTVLLNGGGR